MARTQPDEIRLRPTAQAGDSNFDWSLSPAVAAPLIVGACAVTWFWTYGLWDLWGADEHRYVQIAKELLNRRNWFLLTLFGEPYDQKPPLPFWMIALMLKLSGGEISPWAVRLPSVLFATATVLMTYDIGRRVFGARAGLIGALVLLSTPLFARQAATVRLDILFTGWITAALWVWISGEGAKPISIGRALAFWLLTYAAFLTKGPLALIIVFSPIVGECWVRRSRHPWSDLRPTMGLIGLASVIIGWMWMEQAAIGGSFVREQIAGETFGRLLKGSHKNPFWYYAYSLFTSSFMPWAPFLAAGLIAMYRARGAGDTSRLAAILCWAFLPLALLHLSAGKRHQYLMPLLPPMSLIVGWFFDAKLLRRGLPPWILRSFQVAGITTSIALILFGAWIWERPQDFWTFELYTQPVNAIPLIGVGLLVGGAATYLAVRETVSALLVFLFVMLCGAQVAIFTGINPALNPRNSSVLFTKELRFALPPGERTVGALGKAESPKYYAYGDFDVRPLKAKVKTFRRGERLPSVLIARRKDVEKLGDAIYESGYSRSFSRIVDSDELVVYKRVNNGAPSGHSLPLNFALAGDFGTGDEHAFDIARAIGEVHESNALSAIFLLGDNLCGSKPFPTALKNRFIDPFEPLLERGVPFYAALGHHDVDDAMDRRVGELNTPLLNMRGREYYDVTFGEGLITFFILNSKTIDSDPAQLQWLDRSLTDCASTWKAVIAHRPIEASGIRDDPDFELGDTLADHLTAQSGVDFVITGHNHVYERRRLSNGVQHLTIGSSGELKQDRHFPDHPDRARSYAESRTFGWMAVEPESILFSAVDEENRRIDTAIFHHDAETGGLTAWEPLPRSIGGLPPLPEQLFGLSE